MTIIDELKAKYSSYSSDFVDQKVEEWKLQHPGQGLEGMRIFLTPQGSQAPQFELRPCFECNEKCIHCFNGEDERRVRRPELKEIYEQIDKMSSEGIVCVIGGEPTMRDDLAIILRYIKENGKQVNLHTNGLRLSDEKYLEGLLPYIDLLVFPIHSSDYGVFDSITQVPDSAKKAFEVFEKLVRIEHLAITSQTVINQLNYRTLPETFDRIQSISPGNKMMLTFPTPSGAAQSVKVTPRYSEIKDYIQPVLRKYGPLLDSRDIPRCYLYPYQNLTRNCDDNHCIVEKDKENENRRIKAPGCKNCIFDKKCVGVWREYGILYPDLDLFPVF